jgi:hypothetical protein
VAQNVIINGITYNDVVSIELRNTNGERVLFTEGGGGGGGAEPVLQEKSVTPTTTPQTVEPDAEYDGLLKVLVGAIPSEYIVPSGTKNITENGVHDAKEYDSVNVNVPIPEGYIIPTGTKDITENGTHDVLQFASVNVNVAGSGGGGLPENLAALDCGIYNVPSTSSGVVNVPHKMGVVPDFCVWMLIKSCETVPAASTNVTGCLIVKPSILSTSSSAAIYDAFQAITGYNASKSLARTASAVQKNPMTATHACIVATSAYRLQAGDSYIWIAGKFDTSV